MVDARAIALQGFGSPARFVALQGLVPVAVQPPVTGNQGGSSGNYRRTQKTTRKDKDDDVLMFLLR